MEETKPNTISPVGWVERSVTQHKLGQKCRLGGEKRNPTPITDQ
ncbi:hypothetical protein [Dactylococcopsis salina]|nr:hypothetical protein [Dactylococcopsis salina]